MPNLYCHRTRQSPSEAQDRNATAPLPEAFPCSCFDKSGIPSSTCRNHHWGLVQLCQPSRLKVTFLIFQKMPPMLRQPSNKFVEWFLIQMDFARIAGAMNVGSGLYRSHLWLHEERMAPTGSYAFDGLLVTCVIVSLAWFIGQALGSFLFFLPRNVCALLILKGDEQHAQRHIPLHLGKLMVAAFSESCTVASHYGLRVRLLRYPKNPGMFSRSISVNAS